MSYSILVYLNYVRGMEFSSDLLFDLALCRVGFPPRKSLQYKSILLGNEIESLGLIVEKSNFSSSNENNYLVDYVKDNSIVSLPEVSLKKDFLRYDFQYEWNNQGYGRIIVGGNNPYASPNCYLLPENIQILAYIIDKHSGEKISAYAAIIETSDKSILWFNRNVGPIDGYDWIVVENFLSQGTQAIPVISEIPFGYKGAITMRIDCDEAIASGRQLFELYREKKMPFSMAIKTQQNISAKDIQLIENVINSGGSVVGHSHTHAPNWGGSTESAQWEVLKSSEILKSLNIPGINYDYVVSPFHQNPYLSVKGLAAAGIKGFVGGIICNDPDYLMARSGTVPGVDGMISHSQQCMLHGETYHQAHHNINGYKLAFEQALKTNTFFGFLDHPFSDYWYGWSSEDERLSVHNEYLNYLGSFNNIWRANLVNALRFLELKSTVCIKETNGNFILTLPDNERFQGLPSVKIQYKVLEYELKMGEQLVLS